MIHFAPRTEQRLANMRASGTGYRDFLLQFAKAGWSIAIRPLDDGKEVPQWKLHLRPAVPQRLARRVRDAVVGLILDGKIASRPALCRAGEKLKEAVEAKMLADSKRKELR